MRLSAPSYRAFLLSLAIVVVVFLTQYTNSEIPIVTSIVRGRAYEFVVLAWFIMFAGVAFKM